MTSKIALLGGVGLAIALSACAPKPTVIYAEPSFDKYGNPDCRPANVPIGGAYTAELPLCPIISSGSAIAPGTADADGTVPGTVPEVPEVPEVPDVPDVPDVPVDDPTGQNQYQNQNTNTNTNQNTNQNRVGN